MARASRRFRKKRRNPDSSFKRNPPLVSEVMGWAIPGFVGFAAARGVTRIASNQIAQRAPSMTKHAGALAAVSAFVASWFLVNRIKFLEKYHTPIVVGAGIAMAQSLIQLYVPQLGWLLADPSTDVDTADATIAAGSSSTAVAAVASAPLPAGMTSTTDDPNDYVYNDAYDGGINSTPATSSTTSTASATGDDDMADLSVDGGIFS